MGTVKKLSTAEQIEIIDESIGLLDIMKQFEGPGLCHIIEKAYNNVMHEQICIYNISLITPLFTRENARLHGNSRTHSDNSFWWETKPYDYVNRRKFLYWIREQLIIQEFVEIRAHKAFLKRTKGKRFFLTFIIATVIACIFWALPVTYCIDFVKELVKSTDALQFSGTIKVIICFITIAIMYIWYIILLKLASRWSGKLINSKYIQRWLNH